MQKDKDETYEGISQANLQQSKVNKKESELIPKDLNINLRIIKQKHFNLRRQQSRFNQCGLNPVSMHKYKYKQQKRPKYYPSMPYNQIISPVRSIGRSQSSETQQTIIQLSQFQAQYRQITKKHNISLPFKLRNRFYKNNLNPAAGSKRQIHKVIKQAELSQIRNQLSRRSYKQMQLSDKAILSKLRLKTQIQEGIPFHHHSSSEIKQKQKVKKIYEAYNNAISSVVKTKSFRFQMKTEGQQSQSKHTREQTKTLSSLKIQLPHHSIQKNNFKSQNNHNETSKSSYQFQKTSKHFIDTESIKVNHNFLKNKNSVSQFLNHFQMLWEIKIEICKQSNLSKTKDKDIFQKIKNYIFNSSKGNISHILGIFYCSDTNSNLSKNQRTKYFPKNSMQVQNKINHAYQNQNNALRKEKTPKHYERFASQRKGLKIQQMSYRYPYPSSNRNYKNNREIFHKSNFTPYSQSNLKYQQAKPGIQLYQNLKTIICLQRWMALNFVDLIARSALHYEQFEEMKLILQNLLGFYHFLFSLIAQSIQKNKKQLELQRFNQKSQSQEEDSKNQQQILELENQYKQFKQALERLSKSFIIRKSDFRLLIQFLQSKLSCILRINNESSPYFNIFVRKSKKVVAKASQIPTEKAFYELLSAYAIYLNQFQQIIAQDKFCCQNKASLMKSSEKIQNPYQTRIIDLFLTCPSPYITKKTDKKFTLVFGLNKTLVDFCYSDFLSLNSRKKNFGSKSPSPRSQRSSQVQSLNQFDVRYRPHSVKLLQRLSQNFQIIIFCSYLKSPALQIVLNPFCPYVSEFLFKQHITRGKQGNLKDLSKIGRSLDKVLIIDHNQHNFRKHKQNGILISPWSFNQFKKKTFKRDQQLKKLQIFFKDYQQDQKQIQDIRILAGRFKKLFQETSEKLEDIQQEQVSERSHY